MGDMHRTDSNSAQRDPRTGEPGSRRGHRVAHPKQVIVRQRQPLQQLPAIGGQPQPSGRLSQHRVTAARTPYHLGAEYRMSVTTVAA